MSAVSVTSRPSGGWIRTITSRAYADTPALVDWVGALSTSLLLILSFPNFEIAALAWIGLVPLLLVIARRPSPVRALILGWTAGSVFFYGTCYWLTYSMIHYGGLPSLVAYMLLIPGAIVVGLFPGIFAFLLALIIQRWGSRALLLSPFIWAAMEYVRLGVTGQLWNAIGYSQAYVPIVIESATWGGVYAVGALIVSVNAVATLLVLRRTWKDVALCLIIAGLLLGIVATSFQSRNRSGAPPFVHIVAVQPNVPMTLVKTVEESEHLLERHLTLSTSALAEIPADNVARLVVWPESPMYFAYSSDRRLQDIMQTFVRENRTSLLFNSQEPVPNGGSYNSALLINEEGRMISQYDKIRLMPFGEYVPLPRWLPGASLITAIVGDFTPGENYTLMPIQDRRIGVFICVESAYPSIARKLTNGGADVLINISNDGYLGPTAVMRQHLANAVFRAVENGRPVIRVTNTGLTAEIRPDGFVQDITEAFEASVQWWRVSTWGTVNTFYSQHGDVFVQACSAMTILSLAVSIAGRRRRFRQNR